MKKFIIGLVLGAGLAFSASVGADTLTGKVVQGTMPVNVNGETHTAIIVEGSSFLPVRAMSNAVSYGVQYDDVKRVVNLEEKPKGFRQQDYDRMVIENEKLTLEERQAKINGFNTIIGFTDADIKGITEQLANNRVPEKSIPVMEQRLTQLHELKKLQQLYQSVYQAQ